jgi:hypothetical protein
MKPFFYRSIPLALAVAVAGCASTSNTANPDINPPDWVMNPTIEGGIAESTCVQSSGHFNIDRKQAIAEARQGLAQQIQSRVEAMDETYANRTTTEDGINAGGTFESVSRQVTEQNLSGAVPERVEMVKIGETTQLCAMVAMRPEQTRDLFNQLVAESGAELGAQDEKVLFQQFKAEQARKRLDSQLN